MVAELGTRLTQIKRALALTPAAPEQLLQDAVTIEKKLTEIRRALQGDTFMRRLNEPVPPSIMQRIQNASFSATSAPTQTHRDSYSIAAEEFEGVLATLRSLMETDLKQLEEAMEAAGAPWTPGRLPDWKRP